MGKLQTFGAKVLEFLKEAIDRTYPSRVQTPSDNTEHDQEMAAQERFLELKSHFILGRDDQLNVLDGFVKGGL